MKITLLSHLFFHPAFILYSDNTQKKDEPNVPCKNDADAGSSKLLPASGDPHTPPSL